MLRVQPHSQLLHDFTSLSSSGPGYASHAPDAHAAHASWYGHAPGHVYDARRAPATRHPHGNGAPRSSPSRHVAG